MESSSEMQLIHLKYNHGITWCWFFDLGKPQQQIDFSRETPLEIGAGGGGGGGGGGCLVMFL